MGDFHRDCFDENLDERFDAELGAIRGLTWLPWVGKEYCNSRVLIIAESHYSNEKDKLAADAHKQEILGNQLYTREVVAEYPIAGKANAGWRNSTFDNLHRLLVSDVLSVNILRRAFLWRNLGYLNIVQRPMWYPLNGEKERPKSSDFETGWRVVTEIIRVLSPTLCIFAGLESGKSFDFEMKKLGIAHEPIKRCKKIGSSYPRFASCSPAGEPVPLVFIQHPSKYFSWKSWQTFVFSGDQHFHQEYLKEQVSL